MSIFSSRPQDRIAVRRSAALSAAALVLVTPGCGATSTQSEEFPSKPVTFVVPFEAGGTTDILGRQVGAALSESLNADVAFDNIEGSGGALGTQRVVDADADGYTVGMSAVTTLTIAPLQNTDLTYQHSDDYTMLGRLPVQPMVLVARADAPWDSMSDFINDAKDTPGDLSISHSGTYATPGLAAYAMERAADAEFNIVPYAGGGSDARNAVLSGDADATIAGGPLFTGLVASGELKVLGVFFDGDYPLFPDAPTASEEGVDWEAVSEFLLIGPPGLSEDTTTTISDALEDAMTDDNFVAEAEKLGFIPDYAGPDEAADRVEAERGALKDLVTYIDSRQ